MTSAPLSDVLAAVLTAWAGDGSRPEPMTEQTVEKLRLLLDRFTAFAAAHDAMTVADVSPSLAAAFVTARGRTRHGVVGPASVATQHGRRTAVRVFAREARRLGYPMADPTVDMQLPPRSSLPIRPVTSTEADLLRLYSGSWARPTRHAAIVGLALAGVHTAEIGAITERDVNLATGEVRAPGTRRVRPRTLPLDDWAVAALSSRKAALAESGRPPEAATLVSSSRGTETQRQARTCTAIRQVIRRAGLDADKQIKPASLTAHAADQQFARTGRIEDAALLLGTDSLDRTASLLGWDWRTR